MFGPRVAVDNEARRAHHASSCVHEALRDGGDALRVARAAGALGILEVARECNEARMSQVFCCRTAVTAMTGRAGACRESMALYKPCLLYLVAGNAGIGGRLLRFVGGAGTNAQQR